MPSKYKGGDFILRHADTEIRHDFGGDAIRSCNTLYVSTYGNVTHSVEPITEGYRTVIIYTIQAAGAEDDPLAAHAPPITPEVKAIFKYLDQWVWDLHSGPVLSIMANHAYSENGLRSMYKLKANDKSGLMRVRSACELLNYKYPFTNTLLSLQLLEVHKFTDKANREAGIDEVEYTSYLSILGMPEELTSPLIQEHTDKFADYRVIPEVDLTAGKIVRREDRMSFIALSWTHANLVPPQMAR